MKLYWRRDVNKTLSSTLEVVLRQVRVLISQSKILQKEYRKRELAVPFSFWSVSQMVTYLVCDRLRYRFKVLISRVRQATKDVVKSEV